MLRTPRGQSSHLDAVLHINSMGLLTIIQKNKCRCYPVEAYVSPDSSLVPDKEKEIRVLFLGLDNAGKTTTLRRLMGEPLDTVSPTFGFTIKSYVRQGYVPNYCA